MYFRSDIKDLPKSSRDTVLVFEPLATSHSDPLFGSTATGRYLTHMNLSTDRATVCEQIKAVEERLGGLFAKRIQDEQFQNLYKDWALSLAIHDYRWRRSTDVSNKGEESLKGWIRNHLYSGAREWKVDVADGTVNPHHLFQVQLTGEKPNIQRSWVRKGTTGHASIF